MSDIIDKMLDAFDKEWLLWSCAADDFGVPGTLYTVRRGDEVILQGNWRETHDAYELQANRAAMKAAIRVFTDNIYEQMLKDG